MPGFISQNNPYMLPVMLDGTVKAATQKSAAGNAMTHLIDCYCGSGLFTLGSSASFDVCVGIEVNDRAVTEARENAALNGIRNCAFVSASAEAIFESKEPVLIDGMDTAVMVDDFPRDTKQFYMKYFLKFLKNSQKESAEG